MSKTELDHLINDYLREMPFIYSNGVISISEEKLKQLFRDLKEFEAPDMYAKIDNTVYLIEHFEFDASKSKKDKGMSGIREERFLQARLDNADVHYRNEDEEWNLDVVSYEENKYYFQKNFEDVFGNHYKKIPRYIDNLKNKGIINENDKVVIIFWAENVYPPFYEECGKLKGNLLYFETKQFWNKYLESKNLDYMIFGMEIDGINRLVWVERSFKNNQNEYIDLQDENIELSKISQNEFIITNSFAVQNEDI